METTAPAARIDDELLTMVDDCALKPKQSSHYIEETAAQLLQRSGNWLSFKLW
jgi:hypothetical protein